MIAALGCIVEPLAYRPRLLLTSSSPSCGQNHLAPALLHALEVLPLHAIGLTSLLADPGTPGGDLIGAFPMPGAITFPFLDL